MLPGYKSEEAYRETLEILDRRRTRYGSGEWVFPANSKTGHIIDPKSAWKRVCERANLKDLRIHDLRRTLGSWQAAAGATETVIGRSLGHAAGSRATSVYARLNLTTVRESVNQATAAMLAAGGRG